jgi:hypothetical protein
MVLEWLLEQEPLNAENYMILVSTTRKLINTNVNIDEIFLSVNYSEFYRKKYSFGKYWENYGGKKRN